VSTSSPATVSVVVPVLNRAQCIRRCLDSILVQPQAAEIIVIDGGSTDGTLDILEAYRETLSCLETGRDRGISDAFNHGISRAGGDWIAILNSDDWWEPDALQAVTDRAAADPSPRVLHGSCRLHGKHERHVKHPALEDMSKFMSVYHSTLFVHREVYRHIGGYSEDYGHAMDAEWVHRALAAGVAFEAIPRVLANMAMGGVSDVNYRRALAEYRRSLVAHGIAGRAYAFLFYWLHLMVKLGYRVPGFYQLKRFVDRRFNRTVDYER
jgi:glycosyltransferase involved in cell wall biosynthesis